MPKDKVVSRADLPGVWKRVLLVDEEGSEDRKSEVYWIQTRHFCGDIRLHLVHSTLADLGGNGNAPRVDAFAGHLVGTETRFRWEALLHSRPINGLLPDEGRLAWIDEDTLHEDGIHRAYSERWQRIARPSGEDFAVELSHPGGDRMSYVLRVGRYAFYACGPVGASPEAGDAEFSLFEIRAEGPRLVLSTVDAGRATCPVTEDVAAAVHGRLRESASAPALPVGLAVANRQPPSIAGTTP